jgi:hypothetical protein
MGNIQAPSELYHGLWSFIIIPFDQLESDTRNPPVVDPMPTPIHYQIFLNAVTLRNIELGLNLKLYSKDVMKKNSPYDHPYAATSSAAVADAKWFKRDFESGEVSPCDSSCSVVTRQRNETSFNPIQVQYEYVLLCGKGTSTSQGYAFLDPGS